MINVEISYVIPKPDENDDVVSELERAVGRLRGDDTHAAISSTLEYDEGVALLTVGRDSQLESLAQYQHRADVMATAVLERCDDGMRERVRSHFAGVTPPSEALQTE